MVMKWLLLNCLFLQLLVKEIFPLNLLFYLVKQLNIIMDQNFGEQLATQELDDIVTYLLTLE